MNVIIVSDLNNIDQVERLLKEIRTIYGKCMYVCLLTFNTNKKITGKYQPDATVDCTKYLANTKLSVMASADYLKLLAGELLLLENYLVLDPDVMLVKSDRLFEMVLEADSCNAQIVAPIELSAGPYFTRMNHVYTELVNLKTDKDCLLRGLNFGFVFFNKFRFKAEDINTVYKMVVDITKDLSCLNDVLGQIAFSFLSSSSEIGLLPCSKKFYCSFYDYDGIISQSPAAIHFHGVYGKDTLNHYLRRTEIEKSICKRGGKADDTVIRETQG